MHRTPGATIYLLCSNVVLGLVTAEPYDHSETCMTAQQPIDQAATATEHAPSCDSLDRRAKACDRIVCPHRTLGIYALVHVSPIHSLLPQQPLRTLPCGVSASPHCGASSPYAMHSLSVITTAAQTKIGAMANVGLAISKASAGIICGHAPPPASALTPAEPPCRVP